MIKTIAKTVGILILGALSALVFEFFVFPYMLADSYFENFQFVKNFKEGKIIVNKTEQVYIQENSALEESIKNAQKSIVAIQKNGVIAGSGLIATSDGSIITLSSLVPTGLTAQAGSKINIFLDGESLNYKIIKRDAKNNLALIKVDDNIIKTNISEKSIASGTPLFNVSGELLGINFIDQDGKVSTVSINTIKSFL